MRRMGGRVGIVLALAVLAPRPVAAQAPAPLERRGPLPARDEWLLAQPMLTLPAVSPDALGRGRLEIRLDGDWGSDFALVGNPGGRVPSLRYVVDGEHRSAALTARRGMGRRLTLGARLPVLWRGAGVLDGIIDTWHRWLGLPDGGRSLVPDGQFRVGGRDILGRPLAWRGRPGTGLGNLELEAHDVVAGAEDAAGWRVAAVARLSLPTATGTFAHAGTAAGAQLLAAHPLGGRADLFLGLGALTGSRAEFEGLSYDRTRGEGFLALEGRLTRGWSLVAQLDAATRLVTDVAAYPGTTVYLRVGSKFGLGPRWMLEAGITEGIKNQVAATDFGLLLAVGRRF